MKVTMLGKVSTGDPFVIDTKSLRSLQIGNALKADVLFKYAHESIEMFKTKQADIFHNHPHIPTVPIEIWTHTINDL